MKVPVIALYSIKGGVGKTASAINLAWLAAQDGLKTLLCDLDPQGSSTFYLRVRPSKKHTQKALLKGGKSIQESIRESDYRNLDLLPADLSYRNLDVKLDEYKKSTKILKSVLEPFAQSYDVIILDCPPNITLLSENVFAVSDFILSPVIPTSLSIMTYEKLIDFFEEENIRKSKLYAFFCMVEKRKRLHLDIMKEYSGKKRFLSTIIPFSADVEKMGIHRKPLPEYDPTSVASKAYKMLWEEVKSMYASQKKDG